MTKSIKILLIAGGGFLALLVAAVLAAVLFVDVNAYKPRLEAFASQASGMDVKVEGPMGIGLAPGPVITLRGVQVQNHGAKVASVDEIRLGIRLWPLLRGQVRIESAVLKHPMLLVEQEAGGGFNFSRATPSGEEWPALELPEVSVIDGDIRYVDQRAGTEAAARACNLEMHDLQLVQGRRADLIKDLAFTAQLGCGEIRNKGFVATDLKTVMEAKQGIVTLQPFTIQVFGAQGTGSLRADYSRAVPDYAAQFSLPRFQVAEFFKTMSAQRLASGRMDFSLDMTFQGVDMNAMARSLEGRFSLRGRDLVLMGHDLDAEFSRFESSQHFNLVDMGALFFAGPVGLVVTKGYGFSSLLQGSGGSSQIHVLVSDWRLRQGVAQAQDVALSTNLHRLALDGKLDFNIGKFDAVTVALIDAEGCAIVKQEITGSFQKPVVEKPNILRALSGPVMKLIKMGRSAFPGGKCPVFYKGSVAPM